MKKLLIALGLSALLLTGCFDTDARVASHNLSKAADMFEIHRRVVFYNGITDTYMLQLEGACSLDLGRDNVVTVTCMTGPEEFKKHYLGLSDNVTYFAEQLQGANVSRYHYKVIFKPLTIIPDIDIER